VLADFGVSDNFGSAALGFGASDFIVSEEEAGGVELEAAGGLGLEPWLDGDDCAIADESINPLSAVVSNNFCSIWKPPCISLSSAEWRGARLYISRSEKNRPSAQQRLNAHRCSVPLRARDAADDLEQGFAARHVFVTENFFRRQFPPTRRAEGKVLNLWLRQPFLKINRVNSG